MLYHTYELTHAVMAPLRVHSDNVQFVFKSGLTPLAYTPGGRMVAAGCELFESVTRRYGKPVWGIDDITIDGRPVTVLAEPVHATPFCDLTHFRRVGRLGDDPKVLIVAPMSGHYATLLRGTVQVGLNSR